MSDFPKSHSPKEPQIFEEALRQHWLFDQLSEAEVDHLIQQFELFVVRALNWLFREDEPADGILIVLTGRCRAYKRVGDQQKPLGDIAQGELIGETTMFLDQPRSASVATMRDSVIAWLPQKVLQATLEAHPRLWRSLGRLAVERSLGSRHQTVPALTVVIRAIHSDLPLEWLITEFSEGLSSFGRVSVLRRGDISEDADASTRITMESMSSKSLILIAEPTLTDWTLTCLRSADRVAYVVDAQEPVPTFSEPNLDTLIGGDVKAEITQHLVLLHPEGISSIKGTGVFLDAFAPSSHHHVRRNNPADAMRAARLITSRGLGVVFGGASSRGVAHAGVVRALRELGVPVDAVAGSSSGAGAAVGLARQRTYLEIIDEYCSATEGMRPKWYEYIPPLVAFLDGHSARRTLKALTGSVRLEDLLVPCTTTSVDVRSSDVHYITRGEAWLALRSTTSLPAFYPPVVQDDRVLIDGGIATNLPVECVEAGCRDGLTLAIELPLMDGSPFSDVVQYGDAISGWRVFFQHLWPGRRTARYPNLFEMLNHVIMIPNTLRLRSIRREPTPGVHLLSPEIGDYGFFDVGREEGAKLAEESYEFMMAELPKVLKGTPFELSRDPSGGDEGAASR